jgi:hypothetical protein
MRCLALAALAVAAAVAGPAQVLAEPEAAAERLPCHDYQTIVETLDKRYGETPASLGLQTNGNMLQVFASSESGSWTILSVAPSGIGCIVAAGRHWQTAPLKAAEPRA